MIHAVFDTNIIISGRLWSGIPRKVIQTAEEGTVRVFISEALIDELNDVIQRAKFKTNLARIGKTTEQVVTEYLQICTVIDAASISRIVEADTDDNHVLACAIAAQADYIVTGDFHLLNLYSYQNIVIVDASQFLGRLSNDVSLDH